MLKKFRDALKVKDIRNKIIYTFFALIIVRIGSQLPIPGVNRNYFSSWFDQQSALSFFDVDLFPPCQFLHLVLLHTLHLQLLCNCLQLQFLV